MLIQIHDELLFETPKDELEKLREMVTHEMETALPPRRADRRRLGHGRELVRGPLSDDPAIDALLARLGDADEAIRLEAQVALLAHGEEIVPGLARLLAGDGAHARREAAWAAGAPPRGWPSRRATTLEAARGRTRIRRSGAGLGEALRRLDDPEAAEREIAATLGSLLEGLDVFPEGDAGNGGSQ